MDPAQFLVLADALVRQDPIPAGFRSAVSRAYYAAHLTAREFLFRAAGVVTRDHGVVWGCLSDTGDAGLDACGADLSELHGQRVSADYRLTGCPFDGADAAKVADDVRGRIAVARRIIATIGAVQADPARLARVLPGIRARHKVLEGR